MKIRETLLKMGLAIFAYIIAYDSVVLAALHPDLSLFQWSVKPIVDLYQLNILAVVMFIFSILLFFTTFRLIDKRNKLKELKIAEEKCNEGEDFYYAISVLKHTRFSYVLGQNPFIELNSLEYIYHKLRYIKLTLDLL